MDTPSIRVIGGGEMATAIIGGCIARSVVPADRWTVAEPDTAKHPRLAEMGVGIVGSASDLDWAAEGPTLLAVKPQVMARVAAELDGVPIRGPILSVLAGVPIERLAGAFRTGRIVRLMPNLPARIGLGITAIAPAAQCPPEDTALAESIFRAVGEVVRIEETLMDAFTGIAGSGPAYLFYLAEAMQRGAAETGFDEPTARRIVRQTIRGAAEMLAREGDPPAELRARVTSKGGTTAAATAALDAAGAIEAIASAVVAARDRGRELGNPDHQRQ